MKIRSLSFGILKNLKKGTSIIIVITIIACTIILSMNSLSASAETYDEKNPELTFITISTGKQSNAFTGVSDYVPKSTFNQDNGSYTIESNAYCIWSTADDCAFGYREYGIGNTSEDTLIIEVDLTSFYGTKGGLQSTASAGLMIRESLEPGSPFIFFHVRENGVYNIWRQKLNGGCSNTANNVPNDYPTGLRIEKVGNKYTTYYKTSKSSTWIKESIKYLNFSGKIYAGITGHSSSKAQPFHAEFRNLTIKGAGKVSEDSGNSGSESKPDVVGEGIPWEDAPVDLENTLLSETFTDGSMTAGKESITNPIWNTNYPLIKLESNGNRRWYRDHIESFDEIGSDKWTDYMASVDLEFDDDQENIQQGGKFIFYVREKVVDTLGRYDYGVQLYNKRQNDGSSKYFIALAKNFRVTYKTNEGYVLKTKEISSFFANGKHNLSVRAFDDKITVWFDGEQIFSYTDDCKGSQSPDNVIGYDPQQGAFVNSKGGIGFYSSGLGVYIDNILVKKLEDPHGGDYDNSISANWDDDIPKYILNY